MSTIRRPYASGRCAAGTEGTALAGKRHDAVLFAVLAPHPQEPVSQNAAVQIGAKLLRNLGGELTIIRPRALQEGLQMLGQHLIEGLFLGRTSTVRGRSCVSVGGRHAAAVARCRPSAPHPSGACTPEAITVVNGTHSCIADNTYFDE